MTVLGIISCEIFELELAYLIINDSDVKHVTVIEDRYSRYLIKKLESNGTHIRKVPHISSFIPEYSTNLEVLIRVLKIGLHINKKMMRNTIYDVTAEMSKIADVILLCYGLCGNALKDIPIQMYLNTPVLNLKGNDEYPVDDCVSLFLGSRDTYYQEQLKNPGTFFFTPGWSLHWRDIFEGNESVHIIKRVFAGYSRALLIPTEVMEKTEIEKNAQSLIKILELETVVHRGSLKILLQTWNNAKKLILSVKNEHM